MATISGIDDDDEPTLRVKATPLERKWTLLLAEDDDDLRDAFARAFRDAGFDVLTARDGHHVFAHLAAATDGNGALPDALIMDVRMPMCSGLEILRSVRAAGWELPVLLVTGYADRDIKAAASALSASLVLQKPVDAEEIVAIAKLIVMFPQSDHAKRQTASFEA